MNESIQDQKAQAEIRKLDAEAMEKMAHAESLNRSGGWWLKFSPLLLAALALIGGWTQYTRSSMEDREKSIAAQLTVIKAEVELSELQDKLAERNNELDSKAVLLDVTQSELDEKENKLRQAQAQLEQVLADIEQWEGERRNIETQLEEGSKELLSLAESVGADSVRIESLKQSTERTIKDITEIQVIQQKIQEQGYLPF